MSASMKRSCFSKLLMPNHGICLKCWSQFYKLTVPLLVRFVSQLAESDVSNSTATAERNVSRSNDEYKKWLNACPAQPSNPLLLRVAILGTPNTGKSTLTNHLLGQRVCSTSVKVHTTRRKTLAVIVEDNAQIVILDTPGIISKHHGKKHNLENSVVDDPEASLNEADLVAVIVDVSNFVGRQCIDYKILQMLCKHQDKKSVLILNKVDLLKSDLLALDISRKLAEGIVGGKPHGVPAARQKQPQMSDLFKNADRHLKVEKNKYNEKQDFLEVDVRANSNQISEETMLLLKKLYNVEPCPVIVKTDRFRTPIERLGDYDAHLESNEGLSEKEKILRKVLLNKKGWPFFSEVFYVSALEGTGVSYLKQWLIDHALPSQWLYHKHFVTDQAPEEIVEMCIRGKLLDTLPQEIPYCLKLDVKLMVPDERGTLVINVDVVAPRSGLVKKVIGKEGVLIRRVIEEATAELIEIFQCPVKLRVAVCDGSPEVKRKC